MIGAGKTGRGFIGRLLHEEKQQIVFIDKDSLLIEKLNFEGSYEIAFFGGKREKYIVAGYEAYDWAAAKEKASELAAGTDFILIAVGGQNLPEAGAQLKELLGGRTDLPIITAENASHPAETIREITGAEYVSESTVFCTTIEDPGAEAGSLNIASEDYPRLQVNADLLGGFVPEPKTIFPVERFSDFLTRKLYTYNAAACVIAYLGWLKDYTDFGAAANDPEIQAAMDQNYAATNRSLCREFGYEEKDQEEFALLSRTKFCDRTILDTVARNGRDPERKLAAGERLMGPLRIQQKYGEDCAVLEKTIAAAILYELSEGNLQKKNELTAKQRQQGDKLLSGLCGIAETEPVYHRIRSLIAVL